MESIHGVFAVQSSYLALLKPAWPVLRMPPVETVQETQYRRSCESRNPVK